MKSILSNSHTRPIIILQADEGPSLRGDDETRPLAVQRSIRTGILNAFLVPDGISKDLYPTITPINCFRVILRHVLGLKIAPVDDKVFELVRDGVFADRWQFNDITSDVIR